MFTSTAVLLVVAMASMAEGSEEVTSKALTFDENGDVTAYLHTSKDSSGKQDSIGARLKIKQDSGVDGGVDITHRLKDGTKVSVDAKVPLLKSDKGQLTLKAQGSKTISGNAQSVSGSVQSRHVSGVNASVDITHSNDNTQVDYEFKVPLNLSDHSQLAAKLHGSNTISGPSDKQSAGVGVELKLDNGLTAELDATHLAGKGNEYSASVSLWKRIENVFLSVEAKASKKTWSSDIDKTVGLKLQLKPS